jgi:superfamily I DNA/RNA helicase
MFDMPVTIAYLDTLNSEQRRAVEHGVADLDGRSGGPLLVIAGAGSGKTNTLAAGSAPHCQRCRSAADTAHDIFATGGSRNDKGS